MTDFYSLLGVAPSASEDEIKRAYRRLAVELHPDRNPSAEDRFKNITAAYHVLVNAEKRRAYDEDRASEMEPWRGAPKKAAGADLRYRLEIRFSDAVRGTTATIEVRRQRACRACGGSGALGGAATFAPAKCRACRGRGRVADARGRARTCAHCLGRGVEPKARCTACEGSGRVATTEALEVPVPAGIEDGKRLRLKGFGDEGTRGGTSGDLYVVVHVPPHPLFTRAGDEVHLEMPVSLVQVLLQEEIDVPTPDGDVRVTLPATAKTGTTLTITGKGVRGEDGTRGDLVVTLAVVTPTKLSPREREALLAFRAARPPEAEPRIREFLAVKAAAGKR
ncbi:MAG TPA: J domain-containing protein [bacterium]|nr:J domain-containing protein [bacterium]